MNNVQILPHENNDDLPVIGGVIQKQETKYKYGVLFRSNTTLDVIGGNSIKSIKCLSEKRSLISVDELTEALPFIELLFPKRNSLKL